jgi:outer membrane immunogenic protein
MRKILLAAAVLMCASSAYAADMPLKAPPVAPPAPTWTGWYIGINGGGVWGSANPTVTDVGPDTFFAAANVPAVTGNGSQPVRMSGGLAGGQIGFLYQAGQTIFGFEAGYDWTGLQGSRSLGPTVYPVTPPSTFTWNTQGKQDGLFTLLGRVGVNGGTWYPYVTGGLAVAHQRYSATYIDTFYPSTSTNTFTKDVGGGAVGAGLEYRVADHWLLSGEYLYMQFNSFGGNGLIACTAGVGACVGPTGFSTTFRFSTKFNESIGRIALSYKF